MNNHIWFDAVGWLGAGSLLVAYGMISSRKMEADSTSYQVLNIVGSILLVANTMFYRAYPSSFVNLIWAGIAVFRWRRDGKLLLVRSVRRLLGKLGDLF
jgi:hypothetical protein